MTQDFQLAVPKDTLCWTCTLPGTGGCSWDASAGVRPVKGWKAHVTQVRHQWKEGQQVLYGYTTSYCVLECPMYIPCKNRRMHKPYIPTPVGKT